MHDHCSFTHRITIDHIVESVKLLRPGKSGGANGVMSDSFIQGTNLLYQYILVLFNAMLTHGVSPDDFKISILIPIPKGARVEKSNASKYRAVALSSILGKMLDIIIIKVQKEELKRLTYNLVTSQTLQRLCVVRFLLRVSNILIKYSPLDMYCLLVHLKPLIEYVIVISLTY